MDENIISARTLALSLRIFAAYYFGPSGGRCFGFECCWNALQISARGPAAFTTAKRLLTCWLLTVVVPANVFPTHNVTRISKFPEAEKSASSDFPMEFPSMARRNHIECSTNKMKSPRIMSEFLSESII
jgi:hypothetical protein